MNDVVTALKISIQSGLFWDEVMHGVVASSFGLLLYQKTQKFKFAVIPLIMAYALDFDHLVDYWAYYGIGFELTRFVLMDYFVGPGRALVPFHAWEWVLVLLPFSIRQGWKSYVTAFNLGLVAHLIWDSITVGNLYFYSIIYRYITGFRIFM